MADVTPWGPIFDSEEAYYVASAASCLVNSAQFGRKSLRNPGLPLVQPIPQTPLHLLRPYLMDLVDTPALATALAIFAQQSAATCSQRAARQMALGRQHPVMAGVFDQSATRSHQPLLQTRQRPFLDPLQQQPHADKNKRCGRLGPRPQEEPSQTGYRNKEEFLREGLAKRKSPEWIRVVRADSERVATVSAVLTVGLFRARRAGPRAETE